MTDARLSTLLLEAQRPVAAHQPHLANENLAALARQAIPELVAEVRMLREQLSATHAGDTARYRTVPAAKKRKGKAQR